MTDEQLSKNLVPLVPRPDEFVERVRAIASNSDKIKWSQHARERMSERDISNRVALTVLREGHVVGRVEPGNAPGEWKAKVVKNVKGRRDVGVVAITVRNDHILVKTVEWEDVR